MSFTFRLLVQGALLAAASLGASSGCSVDATDVTPTRQSPGISGPDAAIRFDDDATLALAPGEVHPLSIIGSPPANYEVSFTLLGEALDATLDKTTVVADAEGRATVRLRAPSASTTFRVRASIKDGPSAEAGVSVSDKGFGTLRVLPVYTGKRPITGWVASAVAQTTCAELGAILPGEASGALVKSAGADDLPVPIKNAPVGPSLAVAIRAGHYIWGCVDETTLVAGDALEVKVPVIDKPIDLTETDLDVVLSYEPQDPEYAALLNASTTLLVDAFLPLEAPQATSLLDAMQALLPAADASTFSLLRGAGGWDSATAQLLELSAVDLRHTVERWAAAGLDQPSLGLLGHLSAIGAAGHAALTLGTMGVLDAESAGVPESHLMSWTADPDDTVHLGGTIYWLPTRYVGGAVLAGAKLELPSLPMGASVPDALDTVVGCTKLGATLGGFTSCDTQCLTKLCQDALAERWRVALAASADEDLVGEVSVNAAGDAKVGDTAAPVLFEGVWLGVVTDGALVAPVQGKASGASSIPQGPPPQ